MSAQLHKFSEITSEKKLEEYLIKKVKKLGGQTIKLSGPNQRGVPDRIVILPTNKIGFLELKSKGKKPTKLQYHWLNELGSLGAVAEWTDSKYGVDIFIELVQAIKSCEECEFDLC